MDKKKKKLLLTGILLIAVLGGLFAYQKIDDFRTLMKYREMIAAITIHDVDLTQIQDGVYSGSCEAIWVGADVEVTVKDHKITDIKLVRHMQERGKEAEVVIDKVLETQSLQVDVVSGATSSSKIILKAIENALTNQIQ